MTTTPTATHHCTRQPGRLDGCDGCEIEAARAWVRMPARRRQETHRTLTEDAGGLRSATDERDAERLDGDDERTAPALATSRAGLSFTPWHGT